MLISIIMTFVLIASLVIRYYVRKQINTISFNLTEFREFIKGHIGFDRLDYNIEYAYNIDKDTIEIIDKDSYSNSDRIDFIHEIMHITYYKHARHREAHTFFKKVFLSLIPLFFIILLISVPYAWDQRYLKFVFFVICLTEGFMIVEVLLADFVAARKTIKYFNNKDYTLYIISSYIIGIYQTLFLHAMLLLVFYSFILLFTV